MRIFATSRPTAAATPDGLMAGMAAEVEAGRSFYAAGLIAFAFPPLVGMPAVRRHHDAARTQLPAWWPAGDAS